MRKGLWAGLNWLGQIAFPKKSKTVPRSAKATVSWRTRCAAVGELIELPGMARRCSAARSKISLFEVDRRLDADALEIVVEPFLGARAA